MKRRNSKNVYEPGLLCIFIFIIYFLKTKLNILENISLLPIIIVGIVLIVLLKLMITLLKKTIKKEKYLKSGLYDIDKMSGIQFEELLQVHFQKLGYANVRLTKKTGDYGADLVMRSDKEGTIVIQAKRYSGKVGIKAVQEIIGAKGYYKANKMLVVTNSFFTNAARELAQANNVELWDRNDIKNKFNIK